MEGFIVLHRKMLDWEWYSDPLMVHLWITLLLMANYEDKKWCGIVIKRGQLVTSFDKLSLQTGMSIRQLRTRLDRLEDCECITKQTTNKYTIVTICNYSSYQDIPDDNDSQATIKRQASDNQTTIKRQQHNKDNNNNISSSSCARESEGWVTKDKIPELSDIWIEEVQMMVSEQMKVSLSPDDVREHYKEFVAQEASETLKDSYQEWRKHFGNYVRKRLKAIKDETSTANRQHLSRDEQRKQRDKEAADLVKELLSNCS